MLCWTWCMKLCRETSLCENANMNLKLNDIIPAVTLALSPFNAITNMSNEDLAMCCLKFNCSVLVCFFFLFFKKLQSDTCNKHSIKPRLAVWAAWCISVCSGRASGVTWAFGFCIFVLLNPGRQVMGLLSGSHETIPNRRFHGFIICSNASFEIGVLPRVPIGWHYPPLRNPTRIMWIKTSTNILKSSIIIYTQCVFQFGCYVTLSIGSVPCHPPLPHSKEIYWAIQELQ